MPFTRTGKWYPDPTTRPNRAHAAGVAAAFKAAREKARAEAEAFFNQLMEEGDDEEGQCP